MKYWKLDRTSQMVILLFFLLLGVHLLMIYRQSREGFNVDAFNIDFSRLGKPSSAENDNSEDITYVYNMGTKKTVIKERGSVYFTYNPNDEKNLGMTISNLPLVIGFVEGGEEGEGIQVEDDKWNENSDNTLTYIFEPKRVGTYNWKCKEHPDTMNGTIKVIGSGGGGGSDVVVLGKDECVKRFKKYNSSRKWKSLCDTEKEKICSFSNKNFKKKYCKNKKKRKKNKYLCKKKKKKELCESFRLEQQQN